MSKIKVTRPINAVTDRSRHYNFLKINLKISKTISETAKLSLFETTFVLANNDDTG